MKSTGPQKMHAYGKLPSGETKVSIIKTGNTLLDNYISRYGGFIRGTSMFLTGTSGAGKTTLSVFLQSLLHSYKTVLYSREMYARDVVRQCSEYKVEHGNAFIADRDSCPAFDGFVAMLERTRPDFIIMDSLQEIAKDFEDEMGEVKAIKHIIAIMREIASRHNSVVVFIGQMTKNGKFKGPQEILQLADAHMQMTFYPERKERVISWGGKNRNTKDPTEILYYTLGDGIIRFYSEAEWEIERNKYTYLQYMAEASKRYLNAMKNRPGYKEAHKKLVAISVKIDGMGLGEEETFMEMMKEISNITKKTWPVAA